MKNLTSRMKKYLETHPFVEEYKGWKIRMHKWENKWLGTMVSYTVDVKVGIESCSASTIEQARQFIDEKIKEGKTQQEDF